MLRIHFTEADLSRIELAPSADPMWELLLSSYRLRRPEGAPVFGRWRDSTRAVLPPNGRALLDLIPSHGYCPDFLTPPATVATIDEGIDALAATPAEDVREDLAELAKDHRLPQWADRVSDGDVRVLGTAVRDYFRRGIAPHWKHITKVVGRDLSRRNETLQVAGPGRLLSTLHPSARWRAPVLEVEFPVDQDLHLDGRGLRLIPAFFCMGMPTTYKNPKLPPVLVYSVGHWTALGAKRAEDTGAAVQALIGETRARILRTLAEEDLNTTDLARRLKIAPATASEHASVLRQAGLIESRHRGRSTMHRASPLGLQLLLGPMAR
ncbi:ArsR/SmtB family transcription factor [Amycolatopsis sp. cg5]|uniref:ArsR/SmtB family transcription factor n=1 Tax=Amycolatopsis sp. cg5 TaxID=3238802 RepID=UPI00352382EA